MVTVTTAKGLVIDCDSVVAGRQYPYIHIHTSKLTRVEADRIFDDPEQTIVLQADYEDGTRTVFRGYTLLYSVQISPFIAGDLMIWLQRPPQIETGAEEEETP